MVITEEMDFIYPCTNVVTGMLTAYVGKSTYIANPVTYDFIEAPYPANTAVDFWITKSYVFPNLTPTSLTGGQMVTFVYSIIELSSDIRI